MSIAVVVGTVIVLINHGDHLRSEPICKRFCLKVALSYLTPLLVSLVTARLAANPKKESS
ncbi:MAG: nitrate/nitrite transporter NrtS [Deltaproteobacteria bacterium]|nr:nitrate/nitrite transporter NrtS [Deltaproteobacteria bacterium]